jgi:uncharacterized protein (AIM24 family)
MSDKSKEEEFYYLLTEGSEHLQAGRIEEARQHFEKALALNPKNEQGMNLLGLSLFRLGHLDRAKAIFDELVYNNPIEPSLRLNLAMVYLKQGKLEDAHAELERVLELNPDHPRAASYMGLVLEKKGQLERAADFYERAGNKKRADEIRAFRPTQTGTFPIPNLAAMGVAQTPVTAAPGPAAMAAAAATTPPTAPPPRPATTAPPAAVSQPTPRAASLPTANGTPQPSVMPSPAASSPPTTTTTAPPAPPAATATATSSAKQTEAAALTAAANATLRKAPTAPPTKVDASMSASMGFELKSLPSPSALPDLPLADITSRAVDGSALSRTADGQLVLPINEVGYVRTDLLGALSGSFELEVVNRRYRGKRTDSLFGGTDAAVIAVMGRGFCVLQLGDDVIPTSMTLTSEEIYLVESGVLAFSAGLVWENGRLPSEADRDLDIVHLRGSGRVVVGSARPVMALPVKADAPVVVHAHRLVGWTGQLVPYRAPLPGLPEQAKRVPVVRFEGTGTVLAL